MYCSQCGVMLDSSNQYCYQCGQRVDLAITVEPQASSLVIEPIRPLDTETIIYDDSIDSRITELSVIFEGMGMITEPGFAKSSERAFLNVFSEANIRGEIGYHKSFGGIEITKAGEDRYSYEYLGTMTIEGARNAETISSKMRRKLLDVSKDDNLGISNSFEWSILSISDCDAIVISCTSHRFYSAEEVSDFFPIADEYATKTLYMLMKIVDPLPFRIVSSLFVPAIAIVVFAVVSQLPNDWYFFILKGLVGAFAIGSLWTAIKYIVKGKLD